VYGILISRNQRGIVMEKRPDHQPATPSTARRDLILSTVDSMVADFLFYDRKEDPDLRMGEIEAAIKAGEIDAWQIAERFRKGIGE
jgi:hypothetical protein